ncbi:hypothetical protein LNV09_00475 [Paucibacter sp. B2R-40]|uniref:hypothetical protein n=1 Tax=Paucibacter sp. B2R-40 TaxID=2893554 RepID=UPI0021E41124|nr:hypothetical protein [Paucibacter sp. B2R-40]MCV2352628.1 hypothetical protein [Paucibacter sp. B2R-40]
MTAFNDQHVDTDRNPAEGNQLSSESEKCPVELPFLDRLLAMSRLVSAFHFGRAANAVPMVSAEANFARLTDSSMDTLSAQLEQDVPLRTDFGPIWGRRE